MRLIPTHIAKALIELEANHALTGEETSKSLIAYLTRKRALRLLPRIIDAVERTIALERREVSVIATTAHPLDAGTRELIVRETEKRFGQSGEKVSVDFQEDSTLLGGVRLATDDVQYDFSLGRRLRELRSHL